MPKKISVFLIIGSLALLLMFPGCGGGDKMPAPHVDMNDITSGSTGTNNGWGGGGGAGACVIYTSSCVDTTMSSSFNESYCNSWGADGVWHAGATCSGLGF